MSTERSSCWHPEAESVQLYDHEGVPLVRPIWVAGTEQELRARLCRACGELRWRRASAVTTKEEGE